MEFCGTKTPKTPFRLTYSDCFVVQRLGKQSAAPCPTLFLCYCSHTIGQSFLKLAWNKNASTVKQTVDLMAALKQTVDLMAALTAVQEQTFWHISFSHVYLISVTSSISSVHLLPLSCHRLLIYHQFIPMYRCLRGCTAPPPRTARAQ
eukprot:1675547-Pyramimonas_sp.AAC.1